MQGAASSEDLLVGHGVQAWALATGIAGAGWNEGILSTRANELSRSVKGRRRHGKGTSTLRWRCRSAEQMGFQAREGGGVACQARGNNSQTCHGSEVERGSRCVKGRERWEVNGRLGVQTWRKTMSRRSANICIRFAQLTPPSDLCSPHALAQVYEDTRRQLRS